jgi:hypothetical protein
MTATELEQTPSALGLAATRAGRGRFFANMAWVMAGMVLLSFPLTYFQPLVTGGHRFAPIYHIHGLAFFGWMALYVWQTELAARGRIARHREIGLAGVGLSALLLPLGVAVAIDAIRRRMTAGNPAPFDNALYNAVDILTFSTLMIAAIASVTRHVDWHRRFVYGAALCLVGPAISRWFLPIPPLPPLTDFGPNVLADLLLIPLALHDRRALGRIHPATLWVAAGLLPLHLITPLLTSSDGWRALAPALLRLGTS